MSSLQDFPDVKIGPIKLRATIEYDVEVSAQSEADQAKQDFEEAMELLRQQGGAEVTWKEKYK